MMKRAGEVSNIRSCRGERGGRSEWRPVAERRRAGATRGPRYPAARPVRAHARRLTAVHHHTPGRIDGGTGEDASVGQPDHRGLQPEACSGSCGAALPQWTFGSRRTSSSAADSVRRSTRQPGQAQPGAAAVEDYPLRGRHRPAASCGTAANGVNAHPPAPHAARFACSGPQWWSGNSRRS
jgi:hypothetical protein